jgi:LAS superfamily LD-carboxypeptidase LdcB
MDIYQILIILCVVSLNILFFSIGLLLGRNNIIEALAPGQSIVSKSKNKPKIDIDDKKFVTEIKTTGLEKKYQDIAQSTESNENIVSSISKLKSMKG